MYNNNFNQFFNTNPYRQATNQQPNQNQQFNQNRQFNQNQQFNQNRQFNQNQQFNQNRQFNQNQQFNQKQHFNQNNQFNQNQGYDQDQDQDQQEKEYAFAVGPALEEEIIPILDIIRMRVNSNFDAAYIYSENEGYDYFTILVDNMQLLKEITKIKKIEYANKVVFISPCERQLTQIYIDFIESIFPECITGPFLDLSNIKMKSRPNVSIEGESGIDINLRFSTLPFLLFLCSLKCQSLSRNIQYIGFDNNFLASPKHLVYFSDFFPSLRKISLSGSKFEQETKEEQDQNKNLSQKNKIQDNNNYLKNQLEILAKRDVTVALEQPMSHFEFEDKKKRRFFFGHPGFRKPPPPPRKAIPLEDVLVPEIIPIERTKKSEYIVDLERRQLSEIHKYYSTTNDFIEDFLFSAKESIDSTFPFYEEQSIFSLTVDKCPPNSSMAYYTQFSTNRLFNSLPQPFGPSAIINAQQEVFGEKFDSIVSSVNQMKLTDNSYAIVIHGVFNCCLDDSIYAFDRTLMVLETETKKGFSIINDHIFIRNSRNL